MIPRMRVSLIVAAAALATAACAAEAEPLEASEPASASQPPTVDDEVDGEIDADDIDIADENLAAVDVSITPKPRRGCSETTRKSRQRAVDDLCKPEGLRMTCKKYVRNRLDCRDVRAIIRRLKDCIPARRRMNEWYERCDPSGADDGHRQALRDHKNALDYCRDVEDILCK